MAAPLKKPSDLCWAGKTLNLQHPQIMGVLNITPDSFSDGGRFYDPGAARVDLGAVVDSARKMCDAGAAILDIGGESTRPGAQAVDQDEELARVIPVLQALRGMDIMLSVDTRHTRVAAAAIEAGAHIINDVSAGADSGMLELIAGHDVGYVLMHMQGTPRDMQTAPAYDEVVEDVKAYLQSRLQACKEAGIQPRQLVLDPGFGFGKTLQHNLQLLARLRVFKSLGCPLLAGLSRKSMLAKLTGRAVDQRVHGSVAAAQVAVQRGADIVRVHDVAATMDMLQVWRAVRDRDEQLEGAAQ